MDHQILATHFVEEIELVDSTTSTDTHEDNFSAVESASKSSQEILIEPAQTTDYDLEPEADDYCASPTVEKSILPSHQEVIDVLQQLREIPCTPRFRLNAEIQRTVKRCWENVPGAIGYLKEALRTWKGIKSPEAVFVAACKDGRKPEAQQAKSGVVAWFEWARRERIVIAMLGSDVYTPSGEAVNLQSMMRRFGILE